MHHINLSAGSAIRLTATARPKLAPHRWNVRLFTATDTQADPLARLSYGSQIGEQDCDQRVDIPIQDKDCRIEVTCGRAVPGGWQDRGGFVEHDTPSLLVIGFADAGPPQPQGDDVVLSFAFSGAARPDARQ